MICGDDRRPDNITRQPTYPDRTTSKTGSINGPNIAVANVVCIRYERYVWGEVHERTLVEIESHPAGPLKQEANLQDLYT